MFQQPALSLKLGKPRQRHFLLMSDANNGQYTRKYRLSLSGFSALQVTLGSSFVFQMTPSQRAEAEWEIANIGPITVSQLEVSKTRITVCITHGSYP
jgi:hypothetical protein